MTNQSPPPPPPPPAAPPPPPAPAPAEPPAFLAGLDDAARDHIAKSGYKADTAEDLILGLTTANIAANAKLGRPQDQLLIKPSGDFAENRDGYLAAARAIGAPEDKAGYGEAPAIEGLQFKDGMWDKMTDLFVANGVQTWQVPGVLQGIGELVKGQMPETKTPEQLQQEGTDALVGEVGQAKADQMIADTKALLKHKGDAGFVEFLVEKGLANDPRAAKFLSGIMADYKESGLIAPQDGQGQGAQVMSKGQAAEAIRQLEADPQFMKQYQGRNEPGHAEAVKKMTGLMALAHPPAQPTQ